MAIKTDASGRRWVEMEIVVPGTPDDVFKAVATGEGNAAWFVKGTIEPKVGGAMTLDFGDNVANAQVTAWQSPMNFSYVEPDWMNGAPPLTTEIVVTPRTRDACLMRMTHFMFTRDAKWDQLLEHFELGWQSMFMTLRGYLAHFRNQPASTFAAKVTTKETQSAGWKRLATAFGANDLSVGTKVTSTTTPEPVSGVLEYLHQDDVQRNALVRVDDGFFTFGTFGSHDGSMMVAVARYRYGSTSPMGDQLQQWQTWLAET